MIGGSDAGAHLDRMCGAPYTTEFLGDCLRGRQLIDARAGRPARSPTCPARLFGLTRPGRDRRGLARRPRRSSTPTRSTSELLEMVDDLPGRHRAASYAGSVGVRSVLVGGVEVVRDGQPTGARPGTLLRSGVDTETVATRLSSSGGRPSSTGWTAASGSTVRSTAHDRLADAPPCAQDRPGANSGEQQQSRGRRGRSARCRSPARCRRARARTPTAARSTPKDQHAAAVAVAQAHQPVVQVVLVGRGDARARVRARRTMANTRVEDRHAEDEAAG